MTFDPEAAGPFTGPAAPVLPARRSCAICLAALVAFLPLLAGCRRAAPEAHRIAGERSISLSIPRIAAGQGRDYEIRNSISMTVDHFEWVPPFPADFSMHEAGVIRTCARLDSGRRPDLTQDQCRQLLSYMKACEEKARAGGSGAHSRTRTSTTARLRD